MKVALPPLHKTQREVRDHPARFKVLACGRRWGKTYLGSAMSVDTALRRGRAWWVAPSYKMGAPGWRGISWLAGQIPGAQLQKGQMLWVMPGGGVVQVRSADDPQSLRGDALDLVVPDECASMREEAWTEALRPALSDRRGGAIFISTPRGHNWFYDLWMRGQEGRREWKSWNFPTSDNPHIDPAEIEQARLDLPDRVFRQEYLAEFVDIKGALAMRTWFGIVGAAPAHDWQVRAWDLAATQRKLMSDDPDYTVGALVTKAKGHYYVEDVVRARIGPGAVEALILQTARLDGRGVSIHLAQDPGQAGKSQIAALVRMLAGFAVGSDRVTGDKVSRAWPFLSQAKHDNVSLVRGEWNRAWIDEMCAFPVGKHDDQVDATADAFNALAEVRAPLPQVQARIGRGRSSAAYNPRRRQR